MVSQRFINKFEPSVAAAVVAAVAAAAEVVAAAAAAVAAAAAGCDNLKVVLGPSYHLVQL